MDENDPRFMRFCHAHYAVLRSLGEAAAGRDPDAPTYATTLAERREVRRALADLADAMIDLGMSAALYMDTVRALAAETLGAAIVAPDRVLDSPAAALLLFDAGLEYSAAASFAPGVRDGRRTPS